jgi:hypothetical protein
LTNGSTIANRAAIYFDYNAPVITQTWLYTIGEPTSAISPISSNLVKTYPCPAHELLYVECLNIGDEPAIFIYDIFGRNVLTSSLIAESTNQIKISHLNSGYYFYRVRTFENEFISGRIVKL